MADERYITEDPELDDGQTADEDGEGAGLYEHFAVVADKGQAPLRLDKFLTVRPYCGRGARAPAFGRRPTAAAYS